MPFQINLHYVDADPDSTFMGETREERIEEFLEENDCPVLAMYEGSWLRVQGDHATVTGRSRLFQRTGIEALRRRVATCPSCCTLTPDVRRRAAARSTR